MMITILNKNNNKSNHNIDSSNNAVFCLVLYISYFRSPQSWLFGDMMCKLQSWHISEVALQVACKFYQANQTYKDMNSFFSSLFFLVCFCSLLHNRLTGLPNVCLNWFWIFFCFVYLIIIASGCANDMCSEPSDHGRQNHHFMDVWHASLFHSKWNK